MATLMLQNIRVNPNILEDSQYKYLFSVEEVNKLVLQGMPFRLAYQKVGLDIETGKFYYSTSISHTHEGSIGNLSNVDIEANMVRIVGSFGFDKLNEHLQQLVS